jgi:hypothetical protein
VETAAALRDVGFSVQTHLRGDRQPVAGISSFVSEYPAQLVVLGLGRHGLGIGRGLWRRHALPILYLDARGG